MNVPFRLVDVFTDRPLAGNQLCVVPDPVDGLDTDLMQALAREIGFSETTFVSEAVGDRYAMRIFTPGSELQFAGHPTLGTAFVLASEGRITSPATQVVAAGEFHVEADVDTGRARVRQHAPEFDDPHLDRAQLANAVTLKEGDLHPDLEPMIVSTGMAHLMLPAACPEIVALARPDQAALDAALGPLGMDAVYVFAVEGDGRAKARLFTTGLGISEDPATGSAAGPLGAYLAKHRLAGMPGVLVISQGEEMGRPSELHVEITSDGEVWVEGGVSIVGRGEFQI